MLDDHALPDLTGPGELVKVCERVRDVWEDEVLFHPVFEVRVYGYGAVSAQHIT